MKLKHPEMRELPVKSSSVFSTERDERQYGCQDAYLLANHCKTETGDVSSNTSTLVSSVGMPPLVQAQQWFGVALAPTVWGGRVK